MVNGGDSRSVTVEVNDSVSARLTHPVVLVLDNLRSAYNIGNIFRLAEVCRLESIVTCGYSASPPHPKLEKTARGCDKLVPCRHADTCARAVMELKSNGYQVIGVETIKEAASIWDVSITPPVALVFGNEALGISRDTLELCDTYARLPVYGYKNSLNVS